MTSMGIEKEKSVIRDVVVIVVCFLCICIYINIRLVRMYEFNLLRIVTRGVSAVVARIEPA